MVITRVSKTSLSEAVDRNLARLILRGELLPGTKLLAESELAERFGVSRNIVREGLRRLTAQGLVATRPGDGVYVQAPGQSTVVDALARYIQLNRGEHWLDELYEMRRLLETGSAELAAQRATAHDIAALEAALEEMQRHTNDPQAWAEADWQFHEALAVASHNSLLPMVLKPLHDQAVHAFAEGWHYPHAYQSGLYYHTEILAHVRAHDARAARSAMFDHLNVSYQEVSAALYQSSAEEGSP